MGCKAEFASEGAQRGDGDARARENEVDFGNDLGGAILVNGDGQIREVERKTDELDDLGSTSALGAFFRETKYEQQGDEEVLGSVGGSFRLAQTKEVVDINNDVVAM